MKGVGIVKKYLYVINYPEYEKELAMMEFRKLFKADTEEKYLFSNIYVNPSRSPFLKEMIKIKFSCIEFREIIEYINCNNLTYDDFKVIYIKFNGDKLKYKERLDCVREVGININGEANIHNPKNILALTYFNGEWIFGEYEKNDYEWHIFERKPYNYSNSLGMRVAKALVNIAVGLDQDIKLVDPCCGVGTVVLQALDMGIDVKGYEINKQIACNARNNLEFFGFERDIIIPKDMHLVDQSYDVGIIDLPYGLFTPITPGEQKALINSARRLCNKLVLVVFEDMNDMIVEAGFNIEDTCVVHKGKFKRIIHICS